MFCIFNLGPDPVENLVSENSSEEIKQAIRKKFDLDLSFGKRYALYLNNLSPLSVLDKENDKSRIYFDQSKYEGFSIMPLPNGKSLVLKKPYLSRSYLNERKVSEVIAESLPGTVVLAVLAISIALIIGLLIGVQSALHQGTWIDHVVTFFSVLGMSGPSFFMAILIAWIGGWLWYDHIHIPYLPLAFVLIAVLTTWAYKKKFPDKNVSYFLTGGMGLILGLLLWSLGVSTSVLVLPGTGLSMNGSLYEVDVFEGRYLNLNNLILPAITLGIRPLAVIVQLTRSALLEELSKDYIRTARAKGVGPRRVLFKHALRNALNPVVTAVSGWFASLLAGAVFVEFVFGYKGLGMLTYNALEKDDLPVVMGAVLVIALTFVVINIAVDILYGILDPRVRTSA